MRRMEVEKLEKKGCRGRMKIEKGSNARRGGLLWPCLYLYLYLYLSGIYKLMVNYQDR